MLYRKELQKAVPFFFEFSLKIAKNFTKFFEKIAKFKCLQTLEGHTSLVTFVSYSPDGKYIASGSWDKTIKIWDAESGKCVKTLEGHTKGVRSIAFSPDGKHIFSGSNDNTIKIWEIE